MESFLLKPAMIAAECLVLICGQGPNLTSMRFPPKKEPLALPVALFAGASLRPSLSPSMLSSWAEASQV
jgi:hypothetical protein